MERWGEFPDDRKQKEEQTPNVTIDIERAMKGIFPGHFEPEYNPTKLATISVGPLNSLISYGILLHKYQNNINDRINCLAIDDNTASEEKHLRIPQRSEVPCIEKKSNLNIRFKKNDAQMMEDDFELPELNKALVNKILSQSIATMFAYVGYETGEPTALNVLTDVLKDFLRNISIDLKNALGSDPSNSPHAIEQVLIKVGMGGVKGLNDYYQSRVLKYTSRLESRCEELSEKYKELLIPKCPSPVDQYNKLIRVKVEEDDVEEVENPVLPPIDVNFSILEMGLQLLNSLEAEANLQDLGDVVEDISVPATEPADNMYQQQLSPPNKKNKFK